MLSTFYDRELALYSFICNATNIKKTRVNFLLLKNAKELSSSFSILTKWDIIYKKKKFFIKIHFIHNIQQMESQSCRFAS
jgi:hypothetical protein